MNGFTDADWDAYIKKLDAYGMDQYLSLFQKYLDAYYADDTSSSSSSASTN